MSDSDSDVSMSDATPSAASLGTSLDDVDLNDPTLDFSLPSADELSRLRQTQLMYKSNMFRLQLDELLHESRFFQPDSTGDTQLYGPPLSYYVFSLVSLSHPFNTLLPISHTQC